MKAIVYTQYGPPDVLQLMEVTKPVPKEDQVLVKVRAASVNFLDYRHFKNLSTLSRLIDQVSSKSTDKVLGADIAGNVESVGAAVKQFQPGDEVFGISTGFVGGFAEYTCAAENDLAPKPANVSFEAAAAIPISALTALQGIRDKGGIRPGQKVLINGASGGVGTFAVQIAKSFGAEVTAVCSARNLEMARSLGADHVVDYAREDFTQNGHRYNLILGVNGYHSILNYRRSLSPGGAYVLIGGDMPQLLQGMLIGPALSRIGGKKMGFMGITKINQTDLIFVKDLVEAGKIMPVIDRVYPLHEVAEAIRYLVDGHSAGKVVLTVDQVLKPGTSQNGECS